MVLYICGTDMYVLKADSTYIFIFVYFSKYFSSVMERVGDRLADSLVPLPRLREDSCLSIRPCSDLSSELGDVGIANNDIRNEHPLDVNNESQCSPETEQGHEHGNEYGHGHDTASDLSDDVEENVGNLSFYDSYDLGEVVSNLVFAYHMYPEPAYCFR